MNPSIAMDADGDFVISWDGNGATPNQLNPSPATDSDVDSQGVWIRSFNLYDATHPTGVNPNGAVGTQSRINTTTAGAQKFASLAMTPEGDVVAVWSGNGVGDQHGIFFRSYKQTTYTAGPMATELRSTGNQLIGSGTTDPDSPVTQIKVIFDEDMDVTASSSDPHSVTNRAIGSWWTGRATIFPARSPASPINSIRRRTSSRRRSPSAGRWPAATTS